MSPREQYPQLIVCAVTAYGDYSPLANNRMDILAQARVRTVGTAMTPRKSPPRLPISWGRSWR